MQNVRTKKKLKCKKLVFLILGFVFFVMSIYNVMAAYNYTCESQLQYNTDLANARIAKTHTIVNPDFFFGSWETGTVENWGQVYLYGDGQGLSVINSTEGCDTSNYCLKIAYNQSARPEPYRGVLSNSDWSNTTTSLVKNYSGLSFWYKGDGGNFTLSHQSETIQFNNLTGDKRNCWMQDNLQDVVFNDTDWHYYYLDFGDCNAEELINETIIRIRFNFEFLGNGSGYVLIDNVTFTDKYYGGVGDYDLTTRTSARRNGRRQEGIYAMAYLYNLTGNETLLNYTLIMGDWLSQHQLPDGGWTEYLGQEYSTSASTGFPGVSFMKTLDLLKDNSRMQENITIFKYQTRSSGNFITATRGEIWNTTAEKIANYTLNFNFPSNPVFNQYYGHLHAAWLYANYSGLWNIYNDSINSQLDLMSNSWQIQDFGISVENNNSDSNFGLDGHYYAVGTTHASWFYLDSKLNSLSIMLNKIDQYLINLDNNGYFNLTLSSRGNPSRGGDV